MLAPIFCRWWITPTTGHTRKAHVNYDQVLVGIGFDLLMFFAVQCSEISGQQRLLSNANYGLCYIELRMVTCSNGVGIYRDGTSAIMSRSVIETKFHIRNNVNELISKGVFNICFHFNYAN
jgi:hypothetical protein